MNNGSLKDDRMGKDKNTSQVLAAAITKAASKQTYYTIRFFVDRELVADAYRAYGYFRWVDDILDGQTGSGSVQSDIETLEKIAFVNRQKSLLQACYRGEVIQDLCFEETMLVDLIRNDSGIHPGLRSYLNNMMEVIIFDAKRRGRVISLAELSEYSRLLASAVTDAMYYFIGHEEPAPSHYGRYLAVNAAHVTHMLRDTREDIEVGYFNIPGEYLQAHGISPLDTEKQAYREWVRGRVELARAYFWAGHESLTQDMNFRRRLAGFAYAARFKWMLGAIERDNYYLRSEYRDRKGLWAGLWMIWSTLSSMFSSPCIRKCTRDLAIRSSRVKEQ